MIVDGRKLNGEDHHIIFAGGSLKDRLPFGDGIENHNGISMLLLLRRHHKRDDPERENAHTIVVSDALHTILGKLCIRYGRQRGDIRSQERREREEGGEGEGINRE